MLYRIRANTQVSFVLAVLFVMTAVLSFVAILLITSIHTVRGISPNGGGASMATVCAFNAQNPATCDYVADGINDEVEIQAAIDAMPGDEALGGGVIRLSEGQFNVGNTIHFTKRATIIGQGIRATTISLQDDTNVDAMFSCNSGVRETGINYVRLDGNKRRQTRGSGIFVGYCPDPLYDYLLVQNFKEYGFHIGESARTIWDFHIRNSPIEYNDKAGIYFNATGHTMYGFIVNNYIAGNGVGIWVRSSNLAPDNSVKGLTISGNQIRLSTNQSILLEGAVAAVNITGNTIVDAGNWPATQARGTNSTDAVVLRMWNTFSPTGVSIVGNTIGNDIGDTVRYGISVEDASNNIEAWGNAPVEIGGSLIGNLRVAETASVNHDFSLDVFSAVRSIFQESVHGFLPTNSGWTSSKKGSGITAQAPSYLFMATNEVNQSQALLSAIAGGLNPRSNSLFYGIDWSKRFILAFGVAREISNADAVGYVHIMDAPVHGDPSAPSIGIKIADTAIVGQVYRTALCSTGTLATLHAGGGMKWVVIDHQPSAPRTDFYVDGVLQGSITSADCVPQTGSSRINYFVVSIANNSSADARLYVSNIQSR